VSNNCVHIPYLFNDTNAIKYFFLWNKIMISYLRKRLLILKLYSVVYLRYFKSYLFSIYYKNGLINFIEKISFVDLFIRNSFGRISHCHDLWNLLFNYFALDLLGLGITITCFRYLFLLAIFNTFRCLFNKKILDINSVDTRTKKKK